MIVPSRADRGQRGVILLFGLLVLAALALAALAISRSVDTSTLIAGGISFKQEAVAASSVGSEKAVEWLQKNLDAGYLDNDHEDVGYYASSIESLDPTGNRTTAAHPLRLVRWADKCDSASGAYATCNTMPAPSIELNGSTIQWVVTRLCAGPGPAGGANTCAMPVKSSLPDLPDRNRLSQGGRIKSGTTTPYFRIIVRVEGPRRTVSVTEQMVHF